MKMNCYWWHALIMSGCVLGLCVGIGGCVCVVENENGRIIIDIMIELSGK